MKLVAKARNFERAAVKWVWRHAGELAISLHGTLAAAEHFHFAAGFMTETTTFGATVVLLTLELIDDKSAVRAV